MISRINWRQGSCTAIKQHFYIFLFVKFRFLAVENSDL